MHTLHYPHNVTVIEVQIHPTNNISNCVTCKGWNIQHHTTAPQQSVAKSTHREHHLDRTQERTMERCLWAVPTVFLYHSLKNDVVMNSCIHDKRRMFVFDLFIFESYTFQCTLLYSIVWCSLTFWPLNVLGDFVIACHSIQRHIVALEADSDIFSTLFHPTRGLDSEPTSRPPQRVIHICSTSLEDGKAKFRYSLWVSMLYKFKLVCLHFFLLHSLFLAFAYVIFFPSYWVFRVPRENPIHVLAAVMFVSPPNVFELPPCTGMLDHQFTKALFPSLRGISEFNRRVLDCRCRSQTWQG